jgi:hypothetical protein
VRGVSAPAQPGRSERRFTGTEIEVAANHAAEDILTRVKAGDEGQRDLLNLQINATAEYLRDPTTTLDDMIRACYQREPGDVLEWTQR